MLRTSILCFQGAHFVATLQKDVDLIHQIEAVIEKQLEKFDCKENEVLADITKVRCFGDTCLIILAKFTMNYWFLVFLVNHHFQYFVRAQSFCSGFVFVNF